MTNDTDNLKMLVRIRAEKIERNELTRTESGGRTFAISSTCNVSMLGPTSEVTLLTVIGIYNPKDGYIAIDVEQGFCPLKCPRPNEAHLQTSREVYEKADTKRSDRPRH